MIDPYSQQSIIEPVAEESVPGGSYIPQQQNMNQAAGSVGESDAFARRIAKDAKGRASHVNDFDLTMSGIVDGDPVGMETFDLGFFEDGTPAIQINGASVPIRHDQWMSLLTQRNKTRDQVKQQMIFEKSREDAKTGIQRILASAPNVPPQLGNLLLTIADMNPELAMQETSQLLSSMSKDNGKTQSSKLASLLQDQAVFSTQNFLDAEIEIKDDPEDLLAPPRKTTPTREKVSELQKKGDARSRMAAYAVSNYKALMPPKGFKAAPEVNGQPVGFIDMVAMQGGDIGPLSQFDMLRHLASYSGMWPESVEWMDPPQFNPNAQVKINPADVTRFREYLLRLDAWASRALKWDMSSPQAIDAMLQQLISANAAQASGAQAQMQNQQQQQNQQQGAAPSAPSSQEDI